MKKTNTVASFGDFQTPDLLAAQVVDRLQSLGVCPRTIVEPSCGKGAFLMAAARRFPKAKILGFDLNRDHLKIAAARLTGHEKSTLDHLNFFAHDWDTQLDKADLPMLILGNPPWVTNSELGSIGSDNLPKKSNFQNMRGIDAVTGKGNFDISEWMILENVRWLQKAGGTIAVLCKTAVARKILRHVWKTSIPISDARIYRIDAAKHFGAAVDACLFVLVVTPGHRSESCQIFAAIEENRPTSTLGFINGFIVADFKVYETHAKLIGYNKSYTWRSGIKHDCSKIMEFEATPSGLLNGLGKIVDIEDDYLYPLLKSSDLNGSKRREHRKLVLVTQQTVGESTSPIARIAPKTWAYLQNHRDVLRRRSSVIYVKKPDFSVFGVGDYSFTPWKVAISGLYKSLNFKVVGNIKDKPIMVDDTAYFLPFNCEAEAVAVRDMLLSAPAQQLLEAMIFWDEKRPVTIELLKRIDLIKLASFLGRSGDLATNRSIESLQTDASQLRMFA